MLYPAELRVRRRSCSGGARGASIGLDQFAASGGTIGSSNGIAALPSSRSASASSGEAWPLIRPSAPRPSCLARPGLANWRQTLRRRGRLDRKTAAYGGGGKDV